MPTGFYRKPFEGFGVDPRIRYTIDAFDHVPGIVGLPSATTAKSQSTARRSALRRMSTMTCGSNKMLKRHKEWLWQTYLLENPFVPKVLGIASERI